MIQKKFVQGKPIRLATHYFGMAMARYGALVWTGLDLVSCRQGLTPVVEPHLVYESAGGQKNTRLGKRHGTKHGVMFFM